MLSGARRPKAVYSSCFPQREIYCGALGRNTVMRRYAVVVAVALAATACEPARADFTFNVTGSSSDGPLSAQAVFAVSNGQVTITLTNTMSPSLYHSIGESVSGFSFTLSNAPGTFSLGSSTAAGQEGNVGAHGAVTYVAGNPQRFIDSSIGGGVTHVGNTVTVLAIGHGKPNELIAPYVPNGSQFGGNSGMKPHDPSTIGSAVFSLSLSGITADTMVTGASFDFGTGPDTLNLGGTPSNLVITPAPPTLVLGAIALGPLGLCGWLRRRRV